MLSTLHAACLAANTDKVQERKKQIAQIKLELTRSQVIGALNDGSESGSDKRQLTWQRLFSLVKDIFVRDVKAVLVAKERQQSTYQKLQQEALCLVKTVIKLACRGTDVKLKPGVVIQLLMELLEDDSGCEMFGVEMTNVVLRDMLSKRQYWYHFDRKLSQSLLSQYCQIFGAVSSSFKFDRSVLSKSLHIILLNMVQHHDINSEELFPTLMQYFSGLSGQDDSLMTIEHMVCSTNIACQAVAIDQRISVCRLGEEVFLQLLTIWKKKKPSEKLKDELVKFYQLQMLLHHPSGSRQGSDAAFAVDWCTWKRNLLQLYDAIYQELDEMKCRSRFLSSNSKDGAQFQLKDNLLQLAADLCHQLLGDGGSVAELTQISQCSGTQHGSAAKRRRIETGWIIILEKIMTSADALHTIPWLQLVTVILQKYPESISIDEQLSLLPSLQQLLADCKNVNVSGWLLRCLLSFTSAFVCDPLSHLDEPSGQLLAVWRRVCASTKRFLNIRHLQDAALNLFTCLMKKNVYFPDVDLWPLFRPGGIAPSNSSVSFLATYISLHGIPGSYFPDANTRPASSLRLQLLEWMFPEINPDMDWSVVDRSNIPSASCLASSAVALIIRDAAQGIITQEIPVDKSLIHASNRCLDVEWCLRVMSFDVSVSAVTAGSYRMKRSAVTVVPSVLHHVARRLLELLHRDVSYHLANSCSELKMLESVAYQCCLSSKVLSSVQQLWTTDSSEIQTLVNELKNLMTSLTDGLSKFIQTSGGITQLSTVVQTLRDMVKKAPTNEAEDVKSDLLDVCQTVVPDHLIQLLLDQMSDAKSRSRSYAADADDIFASTSMTTGIDEDFDMSMSQASSESMTDFNANASDNSSAFSPTLLSDKEKIRLLIADFLCHWSLRGATSRANRKVNLHPGKEWVIKKLFDFFDDENCDCWSKEPYHLQLLQSIVFSFTSDAGSLPDVIVENLVDSLRCVCKHCGSDQDACCAFVDMLGRLVPHMCWRSADEDVSESMKQSRKMAVQMHGIFWKRAVEGVYCGKTKLVIVKTLINFIECDPDNTWTIWSLKDLNKEMRTELPSLLQDPHLCVRLLAASAVPSFFGKTVNEKYCPFSRELQSQVFEEVIRNLQQLLATQGASGTAKFLRDSFQTAVCSCAQLLDGVIRTSEVCRKRATFVLLQLTKERHFNISLVKKMLCRTAIHLRYASLRSFFEDHLPCLLKCWIENGYDFQDFPYQLLDYDSPTTFCRVHCEVIVTHLVTQLKSESLDEISSLLSTDRRSLLERCLPSIVVHILPLFAANKAIQSGIQISDGSSVKERLPHAVRCYDVLIRELGQQLVEKSILENMELIVVGVLMSLHETNRNNNIAADFAYFSDSDPEPNPPTFDASVIMTTLDYITQSHSTDACSIVNLLAQWQDGIQKVLLSLLTHLSKAHTPNERCRILSIYFSFVCLLLKDFPNQLGNCWAFVLRDIIYTSLHCIQKELATRSSMDLWSDRSVDLLVICCDLLKTTLDETIRVCHEEIQKYLAFIIGSIGPLVGLREDLNKKCEEIVNVIYVENSNQLRSILPRLDPLPRSLIFQRANDVYDKIIQSSQLSELKEEIEQFLRVGRFYSKTVVFGECNIRMEGLRHISSRLENRRQELALLVPTSDEDLCRPGDTLCRLLRELVRMVSHTDHVSNSEFGLEVTKCIGTIGLIDMNLDGSMTDKQTGGSDSDFLDAALASFSKDFRKQTYCHIFYALSDFLIDSDIETVTTASSVLKQILSTKAGMQFVSTYKTLHPTAPLFLYLQPFLSAKKKHISLPDQKVEFASLVDDADLWCPDLVNHGTWLRRLLSALINSGGVKDEILRCLNPVCQSQTKFCELVLPFIIHDILSSDENQSEQLSYRKILSNQISGFFQKHCNFHEQKSSHSTEQGGHVRNKESVRTLLNVIQYLRLQERSPTATQWYNNFWLEIDYRYLSRAALNCSSYYTSLMYCEISDLQNRKQSSSAGLCSSGDDAENIDIQDILLEAYRFISDSDSIYGCAVNRRHMDHLARTKMYEHENNWMKAMTSHDLRISQLSSDSVSLASHVGLAKSLNNLGCDHLLDIYLQGLLERRGRGGGDGIEDGREGLCKTGGLFGGGSMSPTEEDIKEIQYQAACRSCKWDLDIPNRLDDRVCGYSHLVYSSMVGLKQKDGSLISEGISAARRLLLVSLLNRTGEESESSLYPIISRLQSLSELEGFAQCLVQRSDDMDGILTRWTNQETAILRQEYDDIEPILINRCTMMKLASDDQPQSETMYSGLVQSLVTLVKAARKAGRYQVAAGALYKLDALSGTSKFPISYDWKVEEARLFWAKGEVETAKYLLNNLTDSMEKLVNPEESVTRLYAQSLVLYGNWLAKTRSESPSIILDKFIRKGTSLLEENGTCDDEVSVDAFLSFARYADGQYQTIVDYMRSDTYDAKQSLIRQAKEDIEQMKRLGDTASRYFRTLEKQRQIDEDELKRLMSDREQFLIYAIENYVKCLQHHDCHDQYVYRLTSLWFDNMTSQAVNKLIKAGLSLIKSHKFISLMYQLAARMSCRMDVEAGPFQAVLTQLIETVVVDHPHHCLSIILSLANAKRDSEVPKPKSRGRPSTTGCSQETEMDEDRVLAAKKMLMRLQKKKGSKIGGIVANMDRLCAAYIQLANWNVDKYKGETKPINLPELLSITQIEDLSNVAIATVSFPVDPTCQYKDFIYVAGFQPTFTLAGGINLPKIISCRGSDGVLRRQLVKGKDDLRQDAVMQQVFMMVNDLLKKNPETRKRHLNIRTYKVVPLSQRSGILEWCERTLPMGEYLIGSTNGAHQRYRPTDLRAMECRKLLSKAHTEGSDQLKYNTFRQVCSQFHPVFRHFFMERYQHPMDWYHRKLSYTRSVATNSIVGYILGLGDRHVQNILIDTQTAELIHIDLGVAFEQGRILPTPETVPFRLTRDIVDGMGVMGVEGVFRRCCEKTMEVMHSSEEVIITILQVLLYDPLYSWTMSPIKAYQLQSNKTIENDPSILDTTSITDRRTKSDSQDNVNKVAERVLLRLKQKLQGTEDGVQLSISGQVNHLIQEATDPKNLCRLFPGWQAYI